MIILIPVLLFIYLIGATGYFKMLKRTVIEAGGKAGSMPVGAISIFWPIVMFWSLLVEAAK